MTGPAARQIVLPGFYSGGAVAELAVLNSGANDDHRLRIYALRDGSWTPTVDATLPAEVLFVDVARIGGRDRLITYEHGRLSWLDPGSATLHELVAVASTYHPPSGGEIRRVDVTRDLNGDERDDVVVPENDGFRVFLQDGDGAFSFAGKLGPPAPFLHEVPHKETRTYGQVGWTALTNSWNQSRIHELDYDRDGRSDLVFWNRNRFDVHLRDERGLFASAAETFTTDVAFDSDGLHSLVFRKQRTAKVLHSFGDLNGDRVADFVTFSLEGKGVLSERSALEVHFGTPAVDRGTVFAPEPNTAIRPDGMQVGMLQHDFDRDGQVDILFTNVDLGFFKVLGGLVTRSMAFELEVYRMEGGVYPDEPSAKRRIKGVFTRHGSHPHDGKGGAFFPSVLVGDVNGDRRSDLLVAKCRSELRVFLGVPGPHLFAEQPHSVAVAIPCDKNDDRQLRIYTHGNGPWVSMLDEDYTWLVDINRDGKQDVLVHHPAATTEPHRLTLLIAK